VLQYKSLNWPKDPADEVKMSNFQHAYPSSYRLPLVIEQVEDGTFLATSPALDGFLVQADTVEEVIALAPGVAKALVEAMQEKGVYPALEAEELRFPVQVEVLVV
jgi:predicted RNase H-like HicB family nuclease